jgi:hypothetical protein
MKSLLAAAAASAFSFCAIVRHSFRLVQTISASLLRETVAACARSPFANMHVVIAMLATAVARTGGYPARSDGGVVDQNFVACIPSPKLA